ncbi:MAG: hypothetical protein WC008_01420 [Bacilli bacterium]
MKKNNIIFSLALVLVLVLGIFLNGIIKNEKETILDQKAKEAEVTMIKGLLPDIEVDSVEEISQDFLEKDGSKILKRFNALKGEELVGIVYIGETKGWKDGLQVAFGINTKTDKITASEIVFYNETEAFYQALTSSDFFEQFNNKDMSKYLMSVDLITGPTPNTGKNGVVAPATSGGIEKIMLLSREQYSLDTDFEMPSGIEFVSKDLDYSNVDQFNYVLKLADTNINVVVNKNYEIVSIDDETQREAALEVINLNKMTNFIVSETIEGTTTTLVIRALAYNNTTSTSTVVITDGAITSVDVEFSAEQTYQSDYNDAYWNGPDSNKDTSGMANDIENDVDLSPITGATYTVNAYRNTQIIIRGYMEANNE